MLHLMDARSLIVTQEERKGHREQAARTLIAYTTRSTVQMSTGIPDIRPSEFPNSNQIGTRAKPKHPNMSVCIGRNFTRHRTELSAAFPRRSRLVRGRRRPAARSTWTVSPLLCEFYTLALPIFRRFYEPYTRAIFIHSRSTWPNDAFA